MTESRKTHSILFVCLGNTCRSTMAEAIFRHLLQQCGNQDKWTVDSASIADWQNGNPPDQRAMEVLEKNGIKGYSHISRLLIPDDFLKFDYILGMDRNNIDDINGRKPSLSTAVIELLGKYDPQKQLIIVDPFITHFYNKNAFNEAYSQCRRSCQAFLEKFENKQI